MAEEKPVQAWGEPFHHRCLLWDVIFMQFLCFSTDEMNLLDIKMTSPFSVYLMCCCVWTLGSKGCGVTMIHQASLTLQLRAPLHPHTKKKLLNKRLEVWMRKEGLRRGECISVDRTWGTLEDGSTIKPYQLWRKWQELYGSGGLSAEKHVIYQLIGLTGYKWKRLMLEKMIRSPQSIRFGVWSGYER